MEVVVDMVEAIALMDGDAVAMEEDMVEVTMEREMLKLNLDMVVMGMVVMEVDVDMGEVMDLDMVVAMEAILLSVMEVEVMVDTVEGMEEDTGADILKDL